MKLGLAAIDSVCERLDRPEAAVPSVLVAGTNGKGSVAAMLSAIAAAAGVRAGLYTSPHLSRAGERVRIGEADVSDGELDLFLARVFRAADASPEIPLTYFEALTAAAFLAFADRRLDVAILEVGLGGRFDATNVAPARLSIVTTIGLDHVEELGPTVQAIAREKAGVFRAGRPALIGWCPDGARLALAEVARETGALLHDAADETSLDDVATSLEETRFRLATPGTRYELATPLPGAHQAANAALATRAAELLSGELRGFGQGAIARGLASTRWPGRLEKLCIRGRTVILDGCHNPQGAEALVRFLRDTELAGRVRLVFGAMADKDVEGMSTTLFPPAATVHLVPAASPRAATTDELLRRTIPGRVRPIAAPDVASALEDLLCDPDPAPIIVAGSLYLVGEARERLLSGRFEEE